MKDIKYNFKRDKGRIVVAMSGGVDSSVAALMMLERGYDVVGVFLKCWSDSKDIKTGECDWKGERRHAIRIAAKLGIPLKTVDAEKEYKKYVVDEMFKDYKMGITPNPDVLCNEVVKFPFLLREAKKLKAEYVVTGHFVQTKKTLGKWRLYRGCDESKDQSYFLYRLSEKDLPKLMFPIGEYTKSQVRKIAEENGFLNHDKKSTVGICFIGKMNMKDFLSKKIKPKKGEILSTSGEVLGEHDGIYYYTIGQRLGPRFNLVIKKSGGRKMGRWYVASKDLKKNTLTVAPEGSPELLKDKLIVTDFHLINGSLESFKKKASRIFGVRLKCRIRHVGELAPGRLKWNKVKNRYELKLSSGLAGVSEGQAVVFYKGRLVLGGGVIKDFG